MTNYYTSSNFTNNFKKFTNLSGDAAFVQTFFKKIAVKMVLPGASRRNSLKKKISG